MRFSTSRRVASLLLVLALVATGCGGGDSGDDSGQDAAVTDRSDGANGPSGDVGDGVASDDDATTAATPALPEADDAYRVSDAETTFDVTYAEDTVVTDGAALVEVAGNRLTLDASMVEADLAAGDVLLIAGRHLGRVTSATTDGDTVVVETEPASLADAVEDGTVAWDVPITFDAAQIVEQGSGQAIDGTMPTVRLAGLSMVGTDGRVTEIPSDTMTVAQGGSVDWEYSEGDQTYKFRLTPQGDQLGIKVQVTKGGSGSETLAYTADGTIGSLRAVAEGEFADGELSSLSVQNRQLAGDLELSISAAGSGFGAIDFELPGVMLKYVVLVGPVPVTIGISTKVIGNISVPNEASARASSRFSYRGDAGFSYDGSDVEVDANMAGMNLDPDAADSAANIGNAVDAQFGVAFPRVEVSVFDQLLVPYIHTGMVVGSSLSWGPVCKRAYVRLVVEAGYDFKVLGTTLTSDKIVLAENERRTAQEGCPDEG